LHRFTGTDGFSPEGNLYLGTDGKLYGIAEYGGRFGGKSGCGTFFRLARSGNGFKVIYNFHGSADGCNPYANVIADGSGTLYGTTRFGGSKNYGTLYKLTPKPTGGYTETLLYAFQGGNDGTDPVQSFLLRSGTLFGTTYRGGTDNQGTIFKTTTSQ